MKRNLNARHPLKNISASPPTRKVMRTDGVMVTEKRCPIPFNRKMVDPQGGPTTVDLANGFTVRSFKGNDYGVQKWEQKLKAGFLPFDECPVAKGYVKAAPGDVPCKGSDGRGQFSNDECCPHLTAIMLARKEEYRREQTEYGRNFATNQDRIIALMEAQAERAAREAEVKVASKKGIAGG